MRFSPKGIPFHRAFNLIMFTASARIYLFLFRILRLQVTCVPVSLWCLKIRNIPPTFTNSNYVTSGSQCLELRPLKCLLWEVEGCFLHPDLYSKDNSFKSSCLGRKQCITKQDGKCWSNTDICNTWAWKVQPWEILQGLGQENKLRSIESSLIQKLRVDVLSLLEIQWQAGLQITILTSGCLSASWESF